MTNLKDIADAVNWFIATNGEKLKEKIQQVNQTSNQIDILKVAVLGLNNKWRSNGHNYINENTFSTRVDQITAKTIKQIVETITPKLINICNHHLE